MKHQFSLCALCMALLLVLGCQDQLTGLDASESARATEVPANAHSPIAERGGRPLSADLTGNAEVPGPGDPDGSGSAFVTLNQGQRTVCFELAVEDIAPATAAHIHRGAAGMPGPVVVGLTPPTDGASSGCIPDVDRDLIKAIRQNPASYYVNVHNAEHPGGAVRGQLSK